MGALSNTARMLAAVIAAAAWAGLAVQFESSMSRTGSAGAAAWVMLRYFTIITNLALVVVFTGVALRRPRFAAPSLLGGVTLAILLVGVVHALLLRGEALIGSAKTADVLMHVVTPILTPLFWLACAPKGGLRPRDPWVWAIAPLTYFAYALVRGGIERMYAYPFMDLGRLGAAQVALNAALIALGFIVTGQVVLWLDRRLART